MGPETETVISALLWEQMETLIPVKKNIKTWGTVSVLQFAACFFYPQIVVSECISGYMVCQQTSVINYICIITANMVIYISA